MDISRVTRGKIDLKCERVDLAQPLGKAIEMASLLLEQRRHRLDIEIEPDLAWEGDPVRLAQVVSNLLTNAARYTPPGGHVRLRAWARGRRVRLAAHQRGYRHRHGAGTARPGVRPVLPGEAQHRPRRGRPGHRAGARQEHRRAAWRPRRGAQRRTGPGQRVRRPAAPPHAGACAAPDVAPPAHAPAAVRRRILLVDDNVDGADTLARLLAAHGHDVRVFHEPVAALAAVPAFLPDLAVLDIGLPVLDGYEAGAPPAHAAGRPPCRWWR
jgi:hypothetical protein